MIDPIDAHFRQLPVYENEAEQNSPVGLLCNGKPRHKMVKSSVSVINVFVGCTE